ncbi:MAG: glycosyltransferase family 39 protein [Bacteroidota bacterium]
MKSTHLKIALGFAFAKLLLHLLTNTHYGFHRDELLYLALGRQPDWGFWSNPPLIGFISFVNQSVFGDGLFATRLVPALFGSALLFLICLMAHDLGGKKHAQILAGVAGFTSIAYLRSSHMFMPVIIDIFFWALASWAIIRYLKSKENKWLLWLGVILGVGFLNKYSVLFLIVAVILSFLITKHRLVFLKKHIWIAAGISLLIVLPNLIWQWQNDFPVINHIQELSRSQLSTVNPIHFLFDQVLMHFWGSLIWIPGLILLLIKKEHNEFRPVGWIYLFTLFLFLLMNGKHYYTLGAYPMLMAAGGVFWENYVENNWKKIALALFVFIGNLPLFPSGVPILKITDSIKYFDFMSNKMGIKSLTRWERGNIEALPQDYADMFGWKELGALTDQALKASGAPDQCFVYAENYGQAGAVARFSKHPKGRSVASFADTYRLWAPAIISEEINSLIYINDEIGEDVQRFFSDIKIIGKIENQYARERGTTVYLCQFPKSSFAKSWRDRVMEVRGE